MELKLIDGDYRISAFGGVETVSGVDELCQRIVMKLSAKRGGFFPFPDFGSRLHTLGATVKGSERESAARLFVAEALASEAEISVEDITITDAEQGGVHMNLTLKLKNSSLLNFVIGLN